MIHLHPSAPSFREIIALNPGIYFLPTSALATGYSLVTAHIARAVVDWPLTNLAGVVRSLLLLSLFSRSHRNGSKRHPRDACAD